MPDSHGRVTVTTGTGPMISLTPPAAQGVKGGATPQREAERQRSLAAALEARSRRWPTLLSREESVSEAWPYLQGTGPDPFYSPRSSPGGSSSGASSGAATATTWSQTMAPR